MTPQRDLELSAKIKAAMEREWNSYGPQSYHKRARWLDGVNKKEGGYMLPGLGVEDDDSKIPRPAGS